MLKLKLQYFGYLMWRADSFEKTLMLGKIEGGRRRGHRGWDGWMASPTQWTWVWVSSGSWWWTGRSGVLQSVGSQRFGHDWVTELNWDDLRVQHVKSIKQRVRNSRRRVSMRGTLGKTLGYPVCDEKADLLGFWWAEERSEHRDWYWPVYTFVLSNVPSSLQFHFTFTTALHVSLLVAVFHRNRSWGSHWVLRVFVEAPHPVTGGVMIRSPDIKNHIILLYCSTNQML